MERRGRFGSAVVLAAVLLVMLPGYGAIASGQGLASEATRYIRIEWALERTKGELWALCGSVYNDYHLPARHVELLVEVLDAAGTAPRSRVVHSVNGVPTGGRRIFCLPQAAGTTVERVSVQAIEWGFHPEAP